MYKQLQITDIDQNNSLQQGFALQLNSIISNKKNKEMINHDLIKVVYQGDIENSEYNQNSLDEYLKVSIYTNSQQKQTQTQMRCIKQQNINLKNYNGKFCIGSLQSEISKQYVEQIGQVKSTIEYNAVSFYDDMLAPQHLLVDLRQITNLRSFDQHCSTIMQYEELKNQFCQNTIEQIGKCSYVNKQKLIIKDIAQRRGQPVLIEISDNCENQILQNNSTYRIGSMPQMTVKKIYNTSLEFFQKYANSSNPEDTVFDALQALRSKVQFNGIDEILIQLFTLVQDRAINRQEFKLQIEDEIPHLSQKFQSILCSNSILLHVQKDENPIEHFLLIANEKLLFTFGRQEFQDINFQSVQVSRNHGTIIFNEKQSEWKIIDGQQAPQENEWKRSTFGVWLEMKPDTEYYIDYGQKVKIGNSQLKLEKYNLRIDREDKQQFDAQLYQKQNQQSSKQIVDDILNI